MDIEYSALIATCVCIILFFVIYAVYKYMYKKKQKKWMTIIKNDTYNENTKYHMTDLSDEFAMLFKNNEMGIWDLKYKVEYYDDNFTFKNYLPIKDISGNITCFSDKKINNKCDSRILTTFYPPLAIVEFIEANPFIITSELWKKHRDLAISIEFICDAIMGKIKETSSTKLFINRCKLIGTKDGKAILDRFHVCMPCVNKLEGVHIDYDIIRFSY